MTLSAFSPSPISSPSSQRDHPVIAQLVEALCEAKNIRCLLAVEAGSLAWGLASPSPDPIVRVLYHHEPSWSLQLFDDKEAFELDCSDQPALSMSVGGYDIKQALRLIYQSNAEVFEWLRSPIIYKQQSVFMIELKQISRPYFQPIFVLCGHCWRSTG